MEKTTSRDQGVVKTYVRLHFRQANGRTRTVWAVKAGENKYFVCNKEGETETDAGKSPEGIPIERKELIIASPVDILYEKPARMSLKYAELEVT